jgi:LCP family protein required for cell wall assembly
MSRKSKFSFKTEKERQRQKTKRFLVGFFSFLIAFACFSTLYLLITYDFDLSPLLNARGEEETSEPTEPVSEFAKEVTPLHFLLFCTNSEVSELRFVVVVRVDMNKKVFTVCSLSENERVSVDGVNETFLQHYLNGGAKRLVTAVERFNGIKIDRYISSSDNGFKKAVNSIGQFRLTLNEQINYRNGDFSVMFVEGEQKLRGDDLLKYLRYCKFIGDEGLDLQAKTVGMMLTQYISNENLSKSDALFSSVINNVESNITVMDFKSAAQALSFIAQTGFKTETIAYFKSTVG